MITPEDIRPKLEKEMGYPVEDRIWRHLVKHGYVGEVEQGLMSPGGLAVSVHELLQDFGGLRSSGIQRPRTVASSKRQGGDTSSIDRKEVISRLLAAEAGRNEEVRSFRREVLGDAMLKPVGVDGWINRQARKDGPPSRWLTVPVPKGTEVKSSATYATTEPPLTISEETPAILIQRQYLSYISCLVPMDEDPTCEVPTAEGGVLERLRQLSEALARQYGWDGALATNFVLAGEVPLVPSVEIRGSYPSNFRTLARISLTVDPALSPREVADHYSRIRREIVGARHRELTEKHMRLAIFAAERPGESLLKGMTAWNKKYPSWKYKTETNFGRDCSQAIKRLLHPDYGPKIEIKI